MCLFSVTMADKGTKDSEGAKKQGTKSSVTRTSTRQQTLLNMSTVSKEVKGLDSNKTTQKQRKVTSSSSDDDPENIQSALIAIQDKLKDLVTKDDIRDIVKSVVAEFKEEIKEEVRQELKKTVKEELLVDLKEDICQELAKQKEDHTSEIAKMRQQISDKVDSLGLDDETNKENIAKLKKQISSLEKQLKDTSCLANQAISMANFNQQYSQKTNIKILNWQERKGEKS